MSVPDTYQPYLDFIAEQEQHMMQLVHDWSAINSGSYHLEGLARMLDVLADNFLWLDGVVERIDLPPMQQVNDAGEVVDVPLGQALRIRKRPDAPLQVFLGGHMDTVFGKDHPFQAPAFVIDDPTSKDTPTVLNGPGVADLKGGLVVMLKALEALEKSPWAEQIGWEILINPDEEIGSHGSRHLLEEAAGRNHLGLVYEPSLPDGTLVSERKGSGNFQLVVRGKAAHAGREHHLGRNAVVALSELTARIDALDGQRDGVTINPAKLVGGGANNVVPDFAMMNFNVRVPDAAAQQWVQEQLDTIVHGEMRDGITAALHGGFTRPSKEMSAGIQQLQEIIASCGDMLGVTVGWQATGGCCDGNNLAAAGLPNIDTLGVRGGNIHSDQEYVLLASLVERAQLSALILMRLASGDIHFTKR